MYRDQTVWSLMLSLVLVGLDLPYAPSSSSDDMKQLSEANFALLLLSFCLANDDDLRDWSLYLVSSKEMNNFNL
jgi:hypothetical protein